MRAQGLAEHPPQPATEAAGDEPAAAAPTIVERWGRAARTSRSQPRTGLCRSCKLAGNQLSHLIHRCMKVRQLRSSIEKSRSRQGLARSGLWWLATITPAAEKVTRSKLEGWRESSEGRRSEVWTAAPLGAPPPLAGEQRGGGQGAAGGRVGFSGQPVAHESPHGGDDTGVGFQKQR